MRLSLPSRLKLRLPPPRQHRLLLHPQRLRPLLLPNKFGAALKATALAVVFFWVWRNLRQRPAKGIQSCLE